jgi:ATP-binding protein involved in chromosome partitioning
MLHGAIQQFFRDVAWDDIDYLIVDMPPGTGDVALSLSQSVPIAGAVLVTTPQTVSLADTRRAVQMYRKLNIQTVGLIENMSHFVCPSCGHESDVFGKGGGERLAADMKVPFLGSVPLYEPVRTGGDSGVPIVMSEPESPAARALTSAAERVAQQVSIASFSRRVIPLVAAT